MVKLNISFCEVGEEGGKVILRGDLKHFFLLQASFRDSSLQRNRQISGREAPDT